MAWVVPTAPGELREAIARFVTYYNSTRYHVRVSSADETALGTLTCLR